jgi:hypothetical protein
MWNEWNGGRRSKLSIHGVTVLSTELGTLTSQVQMARASDLTFNMLAFRAAGGQNSSKVRLKARSSRGDAHSRA